jgi:hypothetical protein
MPPFGGEGTFVCARAVWSQLGRDENGYFYMEKRPLKEASKKNKHIDLL